MLIDDRDVKNFYKHIPLNPKKSNFVKMRKSSRQKLNIVPLELDEFKKLLNKLDNLETLDINNNQYLYFVLILNAEFHLQQVQDMISKLNFEIISILESTKLLVRANKNIIADLKDEKKIPKNRRQYISDIKPLEDNDKIGCSLLKLFEEDKNDSSQISLIIDSTGKNEEERTKIYSEISKIVGKEVKIKSNFSFLSCISTIKSAKQIAKLPYIKSIALKPTPELSDLQFYSMGKKFSNIEISEESENYGTICILDTGMNTDSFSAGNVINDKSIFPDSADYLGHGTSVASVALFGTDLLKGEPILVPKCNILNFKIAHQDTRELDIEYSLQQAINKYKEKIFVYNISSNYFEIDPIMRKSLAEQLDSFVQKSKVIVVNSGGNISSKEVDSLIKKYPSYLSNFSCQYPSECKNLFSVGSICKNSTETNILLSSYSRVGVTPFLLNKLSNINNYIKPDINTFGGNNYQITKGNLFIENRSLLFPVFDRTGNMVLSAGTSLAAPLIGQSFLKLKKLYPHFLNPETFKAILLNQCKIHNLSNQPLFSLIRLDDVGYCENSSLFLNYEGKCRPHQRKEEDRKMENCESFSVEFDMPLEAVSLDIVGVHSNNYEFNRLENQNIRLVTKIMKPGQEEKKTAMQKDFGNLGSFSSVLYGTYHFKRDFAGKWKIQVYVETKGIPRDALKDIEVRWGISLRINLAQNILKDKYDEIYESLGGSIVKEKQVSYVMEPFGTIKQPEPKIFVSRTSSRSPAISN